MAHDTLGSQARTGIDRRRFLLGTGVAVAGALLPASLAAADGLTVDGTRPMNGTLTTSGDTVSVFDTGVTVADYVINATFVNPDGGKAWDYGFLFRRSDVQGSRLYVASDGTWIKRSGTYDGNNTFMEQTDVTRVGQVANLNLGARQTNDIQFIVTGGVGELLVNGASIAAMDLSENLSPGDVRIGAGFLQDTAPNQTIAYRNFYVAQPPPPSNRAQKAMGNLYGPANGALTMVKPNTSIQSFFPEVVMRDGTLNVRFYNPYDTNRAQWDYGFSFRRSDTKLYRLYLISDKTWRLTYATKAASDTSFNADTTTIVARGTANTLRTGATDTNDVTAILNGTSGALLVNGARVATLDLGANTDSGDITISTEILADSGIAGQVVRYEDFVVSPQ